VRANGTQNKTAANKLLLFTNPMTCIIIFIIVILQETTSRVVLNLAFDEDSVYFTSIFWNIRQNRNIPFSDSNVDDCID
jgi:hypothetical protein